MFFLEPNSYAAFMKRPLSRASSKILFATHPVGVLTWRCYGEWLKHCADDSPTGERTCVFVPEPVRYAKEFRQSACTGAGPLGTGCLRGALGRLRQPAA